MKTELLDTLFMVRALGRGPLTARELCECFGWTLATLNRRIARARELGAAIVARQGRRVWCYHLDNWPEIEARTRAWIDLEEHGTLKGSM